MTLFPVATRDFSPRVNFQCRLSQRPHNPVGSLYILYDIRARDKYPVVQVRVRWIVKTQKNTQHAS